MRTKKSRQVLALVLAQLLTVAAHAETWVSLNCKITWNAPTTGGEVQGYRVYLQAPDTTATTTDVGLATTALCTSLNVTAGRWQVWVTAYNPVGESEASAVVPFVVHDSAPGSPSGVGVSEAGS